MKASGQFEQLCWVPGDGDSEEIEDLLALDIP